MDIDNQPDLDRIIRSGTGFLRNDGTWHNLARLQPTLGMCGTEVMRVGGYRKTFVATLEEIPDSENRCIWCFPRGGV
jgi:hypothetical protein